MKSDFDKPEQGKRKGTYAVSTNEKRVREQIGDESPVIGLLWDSVNWSCGYDSLFVILYNLWTCNPNEWARLLLHNSVFMKKLVTGFDNVSKNRMTLENCRDIVRKMLYRHNSLHFPQGQVTTVGYYIIEKVLGEFQYGSVITICPKCNNENTVANFQNLSMLNSRGSNLVKISDIIDIGLDNGQINKLCENCLNRNQNMPLIIQRNITNSPHLIAFEFAHSDHNIKPDVRLIWDGPNGNESLILCGLIYGGQSHFTSRYIDISGTVWYHDGIATGQACIQEKTITILEDIEWLKSTGDGKVLITCIYRNNKVKKM